MCHRRRRRRRRCRRLCRIGFVIVKFCWAQNDTKKKTIEKDQGMYKTLAGLSHRLRYIRNKQMFIVTIHFFVVIVVVMLAFY